MPRPEVAPPGVWHFPAVRRIEAAAGLTVLTVDLPGRAMASVRLLVDAPTQAEPAGLDGVAALAGRALAEGGAAGQTPQQFLRALDAAGARLFSAAHDGGLQLALSAPVTRLEPALHLLGRVVVEPALPADVSERLVRERLDQIPMELAAPESRAGIALQAALFDATSRESRPSEGTAETVSAIEPGDISAFWAERAGPGSSTLIVAGDVASLDVEGLAAGTFGAWTGRAGARSDAAPPAVTDGPQVVVVDRPGSVQTQLEVGLVVPDRRHPDTPALEIASYALGGTITSRLDAVLREEKGFTYGVRAFLAPLRRAGQFLVSGSVHTEVTGEAVADVLEVLAGLVSGGVTTTERDAAVEQLAGRAPLTYQTAAAVAQSVYAVVAHDLPPDHVDRRLSALRATTADEASGAFRRHVDPSRLTLVAVGDAARITEPLGSLGLGAPLVVPGDS
jgi:predicted Zn-dependent peptidase